MERLRQDIIKKAKLINSSSQTPIFQILTTKGQKFSNFSKNVLSVRGGYLDDDDDSKNKQLIFEIISYYYFLKSLKIVKTYHEIINSKTLSSKKEFVFNLLFKLAIKIDTIVQIWLTYLEKKKDSNYVLAIARAYLLCILSICKVQVHFCGRDSSTGQLIILTTFTGGAAGFVYSYLRISTLLL
jgi:phosphate starvation-inducible membrane PsiE